ncbi:probable protein phosphatase 2C member 13, mitochondrial [Cryptomeria japonica]|uniref:probable protein phosphatase 2C member 13, mitochondrial n=1 Tax=Cryptomeria japonica TaxID=3369 RepID=UPI0027D9FC1F|nr:probable protein phosphatase 2C member 13, mitochondrial [Cryptomeria japonica]
MNASVLSKLEAMLCRLFSFLPRTWRVGGVLAVSRAFGNRLLKRFVVAEPEIRCIPWTVHGTDLHIWNCQEEIIKDDVDCLVITTDGLWDVVSNDEVVSLVKSIENPEAAARKLTEIAFNKGSANNITCVVWFNHGKDDSP